MRSDAIGMFWQDLPAKNTRGERVLGPMPPIPETGWEAPRDFPNIKNAAVIGLDAETYDPDLTTLGPGWARRRSAPFKQPKNLPEYLHPDGCIVGVSVAVPGESWYFPMRHTIRREDNLDPEHVLAWLRDHMAGSQPKVGANLVYDVGWLREEGVTVNGPLYDVQYAEALLHEQRRVGLDHLGRRYADQGKETNLLYDWCQRWYGGKLTDQRKNIWRSPPSLVGPYAEADAFLPLQIMEKQWSLLGDEGMLELFDMECRLMRLLLDMRFHGVRVDLAAAQRADDILTEKLETALSELRGIAHTEVNVNAAESIAKVFDNLGLSYPRTEKTKKPSFTKPFLKSVKHPVGAMIREVRRCMKLRDTFVRSYIMDSHINERVHCQFHALRGDGFGTRSGRYSSSTPNLQNIPSRDPEMGPLIRAIFVPELGCDWRRYDYSQIEYRMLAHFAVGPGSHEVQEAYRQQPDIDYHQKTKETILERTGRDLVRKQVKNVNFGLVYGMGLPALASILGMPQEKVAQLFADYHGSLPFVRATMEQISKQAQLDGYVATLLNRRSRFDQWEPKKFDSDSPPLPHDKAVEKYGSKIRRAGLHKALNRKLQGSAADLLKKAMLECYESGLFENRLPLLTVHDELDFSDDRTRPEVWLEIKRVMENAVPLRVPVLADPEVGPNWGDLKEIVIGR